MNSMVIFRTPVVSVVTTHAVPPPPPSQAPRIDPVLNPLALCYCWVGESIVLRILTSWSWLKTCCPPVFSVSIWGSPSFAFWKAYYQGLFSVLCCFYLPSLLCRPREKWFLWGEGKGHTANLSILCTRTPRVPRLQFLRHNFFTCFTLWGILDGYQAGKLHFAEISLIPKALPPMLGNYNTKHRTFSAFVEEKKKTKKTSQHLPPVDLSFQTALGSAFKVPGGILQLEFGQMLSVLFKSRSPVGFFFSSLFLFTLYSFCTDP